MPKSRKVGRPKLPKGESKGRIVPIRFEPADLRLVTMAAKTANQTVSGWIRNTLRTAAEIYMFNNTLHDAMETVLRDKENRTASTTDISNEIRQRGLYARKDGEAARASQINARVRHYPNRFKFSEPGIVQLVSNPSAKLEAV